MRTPRIGVMVTDDLRDSRSAGLIADYRFLPDAQPTTTSEAPCGKVADLRSGPNIPFHLYSTAHRGACVKPRVVPHNTGRSQRLRTQGRDRMGCYVLGFREIGHTQVALVGG